MAIDYRAMGFKPLLAQDPADTHRQRQQALAQALQTGGWGQWLAGAQRSPDFAGGADSLFSPGQLFFAPTGSTSPYSPEQARALSQSMPMRLGESNRLVYQGQVYEDPSGSFAAMRETMGPDAWQSVLSGLSSAGASAPREADWFGTGSIANAAQVAGPAAFQKMATRPGTGAAPATSAPPGGGSAPNTNWQALYGQSTPNMQSNQGWDYLYGPNAANFYGVAPPAVDWYNEQGRNWGGSPNPSQITQLIGNMGVRNFDTVPFMGGGSWGGTVFNPWIGGSIPNNQAATGYQGNFGQPAWGPPGTGTRQGPTGVVNQAEMGGGMTMNTQPVGGSFQLKAGGNEPGNDQVPPGSVPGSTPTLGTGENEGQPLPRLQVQPARAWDTQHYMQSYHGRPSPYANIHEQIGQAMMGVSPAYPSFPWAQAQPGNIPASYAMGRAPNLSMYYPALFGGLGSDMGIGWASMLGLTNPAAGGG